MATRAHLALALATTLVSGCRTAPSTGARVVDIAAPDGVVLKGTLFPSAAAGPAVLLLHQCDDRRTVWEPLQGGSRTP